MSLQQLSKDFLAAFEAQDYSAAANVIPKLKLEYAKVGLLSPNTSFEKADLQAARQLLEIAVIVSIFAQRPHEEIERLIYEVEPFYNPGLELPPSTNEPKITGLSLLLALMNNRISDFHIKLESILNYEHDKYLNYPICLERWLMEGAYDKAWKAITDQTQFPSKEFMVLMKSNSQTLEATIRGEIALCLEKAYDTLPAASAKYLLYLKTDADLESFISKREDRGWHMKHQTLVFDVPEQLELDDEDEVEKTQEEKLIGNMLDYAADVEVII